MFFKTATRRQIDAALAILRVTAGAIFIAHGAQKVFVYGFAGVAGGFAQMGIPAAHVMGPFVALVELLGGVALVLGLLTRLAALGLAVNMLVAILLVHLKNGLFMPNGYEFALSLFAVSASLMLTGAGSYSIDARLGKGTTAQEAESDSLPSARRAA
jgi:putative oxidoreductase